MKVSYAITVIGFVAFALVACGSATDPEEETGTQATGFTETDDGGTTGPVTEPETIQAATAYGATGPTCESSCNAGYGVCLDQARDAERECVRNCWVPIFFLCNGPCSDLYSASTGVCLAKLHECSAKCPR